MGFVSYRYLPWEAFEKTLNSWSLKATIASQTNDYFEFMPADTTLLFKAGKNKLERDNKALLCFSKLMSNCAMWGHYADQYRGVCMAFYFPDNYGLKEVQYEQNRVDLNDDGADINLMITKDISWQYEKEHRLILDVESATVVSNGMLFYRDPMQYFIGVIIGPKCPYSVGYVRAMIKHYKKKNKVTDKPNMSSKVVVEKGVPHVKLFSIACEFWKDTLKEGDLKKAGLLHSPCSPLKKIWRLLTCWI